MSYWPSSWELQNLVTRLAASASFFFFIGLLLQSEAMVCYGVISARGSAEKLSTSTPTLIESGTGDTVRIYCLENQTERRPIAEFCREYGNRGPKILG